uniref:Uncharacterized protein n=1 Tax=Arundo donax TaxID=35708 RepID=A0A0A9H1D8_ARUDO
MLLVQVLPSQQLLFPPLQQQAFFEELCASHQWSPRNFLFLQKC